MPQKAFPDEVRPGPIITLNGTAFKNVKQFKYCGAQISAEASVNSEI